ncbi:MAG: oxygen-dependent coproporphyrinogen oxidase [Gammaproteobacteria bacterium]|nr:oxygen-dependent coproporphyrinogen oxidase [Gammaproteobacteria bacterium]
MGIGIKPVRQLFRDLQDEIEARLADLDGEGAFEGQAAALPHGGLSRPRVLQDGASIEKAAVLFTHAIGSSLPAAATDRNPHLAGQPFQATAISLIVHPRNPYVPTAHMNLRFFLVGTTDSDRDPHWHFGGGFDLTPYYPFTEDVVHWHRTAYEACRPHGDVHARLKANCDRYFYLPHRKEPRGVGGIFFDDWTEGGFDASLALVASVGKHFLPAYAPIFERRAKMPWSEREEAFMLFRRGRYAEFNLAVDRGTRYGLQSGRNVESVLASLPPRARWTYGYRPPPNSPEATLTSRFLQPRNWLKVVDKSGD